MFSTGPYQLSNSGGCSLWGWGPYIFIELLGGSTKFFCALWHISRAIQCKWNNVEILNVVQPVIEWWHRKWRWVDEFFSLNALYLVTLASKKRKSPRGTIATLLRLHSRTPKSPPLLTISHNAKFKPCWARNQNGACATRNTCILDCRSSKLSSTGF